VTASPPAAIEFEGVTKVHGGLRPLRISSLRVEAGERVALSGLDAGAAETFVNLVTGASLPDEGDVRVAGRSTREIATDVEWLSSLDRFGLVTTRAVLLEQLSTRANLAMPFTLSIDPMPDDVRERVDALGHDVGLAPDRLDAPVGQLRAAERVRLHLARALAPGPEVVLLEHPTATLDHPDDGVSLGAALRRLADARGFGWVAVTEDERFARASGALALHLNPATGDVRPPGAGTRFARWLGRAR
jgi:predicted ABC-type transport system involved in lysophospholipase L1 biosynthesis ATPase subunit